MQSSVLLVSALVALFGITYAQGYNYTERYNWNGTLSIPADGRQAIESGRIYVQLPNGSTPIDIRVHESVSVTLDCGHLVMPSFERRNLNAIWKLRRRNFDGDLESNPLIFVPGTQNDQVEIFGNNGEFLRVANPVLATRSKQSNVGEIICEYDDHNIYKADISVIGFPPVINRAGTLPSNSICVFQNRFGNDSEIAQKIVFGLLLNGTMTVQRGDGTILPPCLRSDNDLFVSCGDSQSGRTVAWYVNGILQSGNTGFRQRATVPGNYTCVITNGCKSVTNTTIINALVPVTINGSISALNISDNGCNRPGITNTTADLCPFDGERVKIFCSSDEGYTISGPGGSSTNTPLVIRRFGLSDSGIYICRSHSHNTDCGATILVSASGIPPLIRTHPPGTPTLTLPPRRIGARVGVDICLLDHQFVRLVCRAKSGTQPISFTWTAASTGDRVILHRSILWVSASDTDVYTCNASNAFGADTASSRVERRLDVSLVGVSPQGNRCNQLKRRPSGVDYCAFVGDNLTLSCRVDSPNITTIIYYRGTSRSSEISLTPVLSSTEGTYLCNATNYCGNSSDMLNLRVYDPARIDRQQTLPSPGFNEVVIGAGRSDKPINVAFGRTVKLFCPFTGIGQANATWLRVQPDGFTAEINTSLAVFSMNNTENMSVLTISLFTKEMSEGTYRCITTSIDFDDEGDVVLQEACDDIYEACHYLVGEGYCLNDLIKRLFCCCSCRRY